MAYMIEGKGTKTCSKAKKWLYAHPEEAHKLLQILTNAIIEYLKMQVAAGADILQVFDSSAEYLNESLYETFGLPYLKQIRDQVVASLGDKRVPMVTFYEQIFVIFSFIYYFRYCSQKERILPYLNKQS